MCNRTFSKTADWVLVNEASFAPRFLKLLSLSSISHIKRILKSAPRGDDVTSKARHLLKKHAKFMKEREVEISKTILNTRRQHGLKGIGGFAEIMPIDRFQHSRVVSAMALLLALKIGLSSNEALEAWEAGLSHDRAHLAYSHTVEELMVELFGLETHEERGISIMLNDRHLQAYYFKNGLSVNNVRLAMLERSKFVLQSIADTASYVEHDGLLLSEPIPTNFLWNIIASVEGVSNGWISVNDLTQFNEVLCLRAKFHQIFYSSLRGRICDAAATTVFKYALDRKIITSNDIMAETDQFIDSKFLAMRRGEIKVPDWICSLLDIMRGDLQLLEEWNAEAFQDETLFNERVAYLGSRRLDYVAVKVRKFDSKTIKVIGPNGHLIVLKASVLYGELDNTYFVYSFKS